MSNSSHPCHPEQSLSVTATYFVYAEPNRKSQTTQLIFLLILQLF